MATTTNYGWTTPDDTALVKDGAAAIRTLGSSVDTTTKNLNPETTLGDIAYRSSTANVKTRLGIGTTGQVLLVSGGVPAWANLPSSSPASATNAVTTSQTTTSTSYTNLATTQSVTLTTGTKALICLAGDLTSNDPDGIAYASFDVTGASTVAASDTYALIVKGVADNQLGTSFVITGLTAGSNTFTMKFRSNNLGYTATFSNRIISVIDMGS
jgi:hypothetical protein